MHHLNLDISGKNITLSHKGEKNPGVGTIKTLYASSGLLDNSQYARTYWTYRGKIDGRLLVFNDKAVFNAVHKSFKMLDFEGAHQPNLDYQIIRYNHATFKPEWTITLPINVQAMALTQDVLLVSGPLNRVKDAGGKEGNKPAVLYAISAESGKTLAECAIDSRPGWDSLAVANGRIFMTTQDGDVRCFTGGKK
jgi:hypothetical protein